MVDYKCGHKTDGVIILDNNELSLMAWIDWSEHQGVFGDLSLCFDCYCKEVEYKE